MADLSPDLIDKIRHARSLGDQSSSPSLPFRTVGELLLQRADQHEDLSFLSFYDDEGGRLEYTYREFAGEACKTAHALIASGIRPGDRIAIVSHNHSDVVVQYFAAFLAGAVVVPVNTGEDDKRLAFVLADSGASLALVHDRFVERIFSLRPTEYLAVLETGPVGKDRTLDLAALRARMPEHPPTLSPLAPDSDALIVYTSGTTGDPKGVILSHANLLADATAIAEWHQLSSNQRMMCVLPLHHVNGIVVTLLAPLVAGCGIVLNQRFHSDRFFERISAERVSVVSVVPTLLQFLLHTRLNMEAYKLAAFRHIICGAGPLTIELAQKFEQTFGIPIIHGYGLSETTCYSCFLPLDLSPEEHRTWLSRYGFPSIGVPLPVNDMAIHDSRGNELQEGERGEIVVRGHNVMKRYYRNPEANAEAFSHGWFRTGDEGFYRFDEAGRKFFFISGRIKELIIRGGANISPFEIDEVLMHMPGVAAGIAVGFENDWYGEEVGAYVKLQPDSLVTQAQVIAYCRKSLPFVKSPKVVVFGDSMPVTSTGKYQRNILKPLFSAWKEHQFSERS